MKEIAILCLVAWTAILLGLFIKSVIKSVIKKESGDGNGFTITQQAKLF